MSSSLDCIHLYTNVVIHAIFNTSQWKKRSQKKNPNAQGTGQVILQYTMGWPRHPCFLPHHSALMTEVWTQGFTDKVPRASTNTSFIQETRPRKPGHSNSLATSLLHRAGSSWASKTGPQQEPPMDGQFKHAQQWHQLALGWLFHAFEPISNPLLFCFNTHVIYSIFNLSHRLLTIYTHACICQEPAVVYQMLYDN